MKILLKSVSIVMLGVALFMSCQANKDSDLVRSDEVTNDANQKVETPHYTRIIGEVDNSEIEIVAQISDIKSKWESAINPSGLGISFDDFFIVQEGDDYFLVGTDDDLPAVSVIRLVLDGGYFYEMTYPNSPSDEAGSGESCTCSGCESTGPGSSGECEPEIGDEGWYCSDCSKGTCTKTVTREIGGILSN